jgi:ATP-dependent helicase/nuclease subunit A
MKHNDATLRQVAAANPGVSTWLSANAGSGKTRVLTDRVAQLLLSGVSPQNVLCLTYTKAAASEMQNRLFKRLGKWSMLNDTKLVQELEELGAPVPGDLAQARTLFARAIETPGGLRIQTIHSFCASLLRRFPLEAGVSPVFREIEDRAAKLLRGEIVEEMANGPNTDAVAQIAKHYTGEDFAKLTAEIVRHRRALMRPTNRAEIWGHFGLADGFGWADLKGSVFLGDEAELIQDLLPLMAASDKVSDHKAAKRLARIDFAAPTMADLADCFPIFLFMTSKVTPFAAKLSSFPTKGFRDAHPEITARLHQLMQRIEAARSPHNGLCAAEKTQALYQFAARFLPEYEARKNARGWLDFDDLIARAGSLLSDPAVAQWVLYRLDGGIDHILVDEAQDTSPDQWQVIRLLAQEFSAGQGARSDVLRTIFVVGDLKQSIYSFQGADPRAFDEMKEHFSSGLSAAGQQLHERSLDHSFRSSSAILSFVDAAIRATDGRGMGDVSSHLAFHGDMPGRVDLWPLLSVDGPDPEKNWYDPTDKVAANDPKALLAEKIAEQIKDLVNSGSIPSENGEFRKIRYDDFLILVQRRSDLFREIIRACKARDLPMAGADRLRVGAELAVKDLTALLSFLAMPDDSLSLAAALRSPLFGLGEAEMFDLAHHRHEPTLWPALARRKSEFRGAFDTLTSLRNQVDFLGPFDLLERILTRHNGRARLLARLGPEAEDGIDALLNQAIGYEQTETPSLTGFLVWLATDDVEIKRQSDNLGGRIRVMTAHGAKGLESPIVFLPDTGDIQFRQTAELVPSDDGVVMWRTNGAVQTDNMIAALTQAKIDQQDERMRLLYVAMTRAEKWLIICAAGEVRPTGDSWYQTAQAAMALADARPWEMPTGPGMRVQHGTWRAPDAQADEAVSVQIADLPAWASSRAKAPDVRPAAVSPSDLGGAKALPGADGALDEQAAMARGRQIHLLLEHLPSYPRAQRPRIAAQLLGAAPLDQVQSALQEAVAILDNPEFTWIFAPDTLAEVDISADLGDVSPQRVRGTIDRLIVAPDQLTVVDFKSNRLVPDRPQAVPEGILRQLAVYHLALAQIYPEYEITLAILWTSVGKLMTLPHDIVTASLGSPPHLDLSGRDP